MRKYNRRFVLASAGALGAAAASVGIFTAVSAQDEPEQTPRSIKEIDGPVVVHLADPDTGTLDIFAGDTHTQIRDRELAARLVRAAGAR